MSTLLNKNYLVNCLRRGEVVKNAPNSVYVVCRTAPYGHVNQNQTETVSVPDSAEYFGFCRLLNTMLLNINIFPHREYFEKLQSFTLIVSIST